MMSMWQKWWMRSANPWIPPVAVTRDCQNGEKCLTHHLWSDLSSQIHQFLSEISLGDLMRKHEIRQVADRQNRKQSDGDPDTINTRRLIDQAPA